jgi:ankyrin repeat protein
MTRARPALVWFLLLLCAPVIALAQSQARAQAPPAASDKADALSAAARNGDAATVAKLLDEGVDVNTKFRYGVTALSYAADHGHLEVVKVLLAHKADVNAKDTFYGATPLTWASGPAQKRKPEHAQIVGLLLKAGAQGKENALSSAVSESDAPMVKVILDFGGLAPATLSDALDSATRAKQADIVALLEAAGAKPQPVLTLSDAQMAKYVGTYRAPNGNDIALAVVSGQLSLDVSKLGGPPKIALVARDETTFTAPDAPGLRLTCRIEDGKVTALVIGPTTYTRTGGW